MDPRNVRPRRDFVSVEADPRKEVLASGIILPVETGAEKVSERAGTIVRVGPGKGEQLGLKTGDRVVFRGFLKEANPVPGTKREVFMMSVDDILATIEGDVEVGCFSGRPQAPERR